jgi:endonuclease-3
LVAVILSAQCTDKRVNLVTPSIFEKWPNAKSMSLASESEIFEIIKSVSYPNNKSKHLSQMSKVLYNDFGGEMPQEVDDLQKLPGVGRKTANVIASVLFNKPVIAVDTHVFRVARRLGLSKSEDVLGVELDLTANIPQEKRATAHHWLILHGRYTCKARNPQCNTCGLQPYCKFYSEQQAI